MPSARLRCPQAADYQVPSCGYQDPLGGYGASDLKDELAWDVDVPTKFCLQVQGAVLRMHVPLAGGDDIPGQFPCMLGFPPCMLVCS